MEQESNVTITRNNHQDRAVIFVHGFTGGRDDTWEHFPELLGTARPEWDIFTVGYATTLLPDVVGIWSADPDLPILATMLSTQLTIPPFQPYRSIALIAHSMGGLIVQKALVDDPALAVRTSNVILFGTPSAGLRKARWIHFWKRQLNNMAAGSPFITGLRDEWKRLYSPTSPFKFLAVGGASDQFVPPDSSLEPFDKSLWRVVAGNHVSLVKPADANSPSLNLVAGALGNVASSVPHPGGLVQRASPEAPRPVKGLEADTTILSVKEVVDAALALERTGQRAESIALLERHAQKDTDIKGTWAGRMKRLWLDTGQTEYAERALSLYEEALNAATRPDQLCYLAINVAFMKFVYAGDPAAARSMAEFALKYADPPGDDVWKVATVAEAHLYLSQIPEALALYRSLLKLEAEDWKYASVSLQAGQIAAKLGNLELIEELEEIFTPGAKRVNRIFVSYSHKDREWLERLKVMIAPYLRDAEAELDLWDDTRLTAGQQWDVEIREALARAGVAVALVSPDFLASTYVTQYELPAMVKAAEDGGMRLLWAYVSAAGWEETPLKRFQATHDTKLSLDRLPEPEQNEILKSIARQMKEAALSATDPFKKGPPHEQTA